MKNLIAFLVISFCLVSSVFAVDIENRLIGLVWEHDFPPDMARYEISCVPGDNASIVRVPIDDPNLKITDTNRHYFKTFEWSGEVPVTRGKAECTVRAVDLAEQKSEWASPPATKDWVPSTVLHIRFVSTPDIQIEVTP